MLTSYTLARCWTRMTAHVQTLNIACPVSQNYPERSVSLDENKHNQSKARMSNSWLPSVALLAVWPAFAAGREAAVPEVTLAVHGGIAAEKRELTDELRETIRTELRRALEAGRAALAKEG